MKRETILSILLNVTFVMCIFAVRYFYVKKEYKFLKNDSQRQETLIVANEIKIDSLSAVTRRLQIDNDNEPATNARIIHWTGQKGKDRIKGMMNG